MKKRVQCLLFAVMLSGLIYAQLNEGNTKWMEYLEELSEEGEDPLSIENLFNDLSYLADNPFDLHTISKEELERLPFLTPIQIENILYYIYRYRPIQSLYELKNVELLDLRTIEYLLPFVCLEKPEDPTGALSAKRVLRYAKQEVLLRYDRCLQEKAGYRDDPPEEKEAHPSRYYLGEPYFISMKYGLNYKDRVQAGWVAKKDAGEPFWNEHHKGFDYFSAHLSVKDLACIRHFLLGDYRVAFGQGLVINTDFTLANTSDVMNTSRKGGTIKRHYSTSEANYLRGAALSVKLGTLLTSLFYSQRAIDASVDDSTIFSIKTDGYRRTANDMQKKDQAQSRIAGMNLQWSNEFLTTGLTALYHDFDGRKLDPVPRQYNVFYLRERYNYNAGINYSYRRKKMFFQGETAVSGNGAAASQNSLQVYPSSSFSFVLRQRYFAKDYQAYYASVAGSSLVQNANAWYLGCLINPAPRWNTSFSIDFIEYPWLKYLIDAPSKAAYALALVEYQPEKAWKMSLRYTYKEKMKNFVEDSQSTKLVLPYDQHALRYQIHCALKSGYYGKFQLNGKWHNSPGEGMSKGIMLSQSWGYNAPEAVLHGELYAAYFHTDDWDSRISTYEKSILHAFSAPSFSGEGFRSAAVIKWTISSCLSFYSKLAWTHYVDRDQISSGTEAIEGRDKVDFYGLIRLKW